ncbi:MAG TPA: hypothetical protein VIN08_18535 [Ohtaekwangia sp.]|uniref:hypothetical protein n=1 Tax=Ohtaekwangia sp. TaxID=2066019 RepID=UPI002F937E89
MKYIDTFGQSLLVLGGLISVSAGIFINDTLWFFAVCQFFLGVWQVLSCVLILIWHTEKSSARRKYLLITIFYLLSLFAGGKLIPGSFPIPDIIRILYLTIPAWTLGAWYYIITLTGYFPKVKRGFLPHLSF